MQWHISQGRSRTVVAFPTLGIVIKCARIRLRPLKNLYTDMVFVKENLWSSTNPETKKMCWEIARSFVARAWVEFFSGFVANWRERSYYKHVDLANKTFLQPTYFSVFGIWNIQKFGIPECAAKGNELWKRCYAIAGQALVLDDHHWAQAQNFHIAKDGLKILDYGSLETQNIIDTYGADLYSRFKET